MLADNDAAATTERLRRLWMAGSRDITITYDEDVVRYRNVPLAPAYRQLGAHHE